MKNKNNLIVFKLENKLRKRKKEKKEKSEN